MKEAEAVAVRKEGKEEEVEEEEEVEGKKQEEGVEDKEVVEGKEVEDEAAAEVAEEEDDSR